MNCIKKTKVYKEVSLATIIFNFIPNFMCVYYYYYGNVQIKDLIILFLFFGLGDLYLSLFILYQKRWKIEFENDSVIIRKMFGKTRKYKLDELVLYELYYLKFDRIKYKILYSGKCLISFSPFDTVNLELLKKLKKETIYVKGFKI